MGDKTGISWTDATWNPIRGCSRVSQGCVHCYAETVAARFAGPGQPYEGLAEWVTRPDGSREARWTGEVALVEHMIDQPLRWQKPRRIFVNSMSDLFHEKVPDEWIDRIFAVMAMSPRHQFQVLTKRPERMRDYCRTLGRHHTIDRISLVLKRDYAKHPAAQSIAYRGVDTGWALPNVWLGVSVEDQATANERIPLLLQTNAAVRWISAEPLLGPIDLRSLTVGHRQWLNALEGIYSAPEAPPGPSRQPKLDWVVVGGESGNGARPMNPQWARDLRDQCTAANVRYFFKQWGEYVSVSEQAGPGEHHTFPDGRTVRRIGRYNATDTLDGRQWQEYPA